MKRRIASLFLLMCMVLSVLPTTAFAAEAEEQAAESEVVSTSVAEALYTAQEWELLKLTNKERLANGQEPLSVFEDLQRAASLREQELISRFAHSRPDGSDGLSALQEFEIDFLAAVENIAAGQNTPRAALRVWLNDAEDRANVVSASFAHAGLGYTSQICTILTQTGTGRIRNGWVQLLVGCDCIITDISLSKQSVFCTVGSTLDELELYVEATCSVHGTCYLPLVAEMCTGFDGNNTGEQTVAVAYGGQSEPLLVKVLAEGEPEPDPTPTPTPEPEPDPDPEPELPVGMIEDTGRSLSLSGEVFINQYIKVSGFDGVDVAAKGGLLVWNRAVDEENAVFGTADLTQVGLVAYGDEYTQRTLGIPARCYADEVYLRAYVEVSEGEYVYGPLTRYSVQEYCEHKINSAEYEDKLKQTCAALLHFGTAAQIYFDYNTGDLADANISDSYPPNAWDAELLTALDPIPETDIVSTGDVTDNGQSVSLTGAIKVNFYFGFPGEVSNAELLVWDGVSGALNEENVSYTQELIAYRDEYTGQSLDFAARTYGKTIFACAKITDSEGGVHYSDVIAFSPEAYAAGKLDHSDENLVELVKRMVLYGETARAFFED